jgi:diguanylate cyclase (GGDEF)-like protein
MRILPFVVAGAAGYLAVPFLPGSGATTSLIAAALVPILIASALLLPWAKLPAWPQALPPLAVFVLVGLVRDAEGATAALYTYTPVVLLPVFWFALYGTRGQLVISVVAVGVTFAVPTSAVSGDGYAVTEFMAAVLWMAIAGVTGFTISELARQREALGKRLARIARTDVLTGLPNRRAWNEFLGVELESAARTGRPLCTALLDLDNFKDFNDLHGHHAGDEHLRAVAMRWRAKLRGADLIARYGGEEFAVILVDTPLARATEIIERLRVSVPREETASSGIAQWDGSETGSQLVARADRALYEAKRAGRDQAVAETAGLV